MKLRPIYDALRQGVRTAKGRNLLTFGAFLVIATVFWFLLALNDDVVHDYAMPVELTDFPQEVTVLSGLPPAVNVNVRDKGSAMMKFAFGKVPPLKLRYSDFTNSGAHRLTMTPAQLGNAVRGVFGSSAVISGLRPDSMALTFTTEPGIRVPVRIMARVKTSPKAICGGEVVAEPDSVTIYSNSRARYAVREITTEPIELNGVSDTTEVSAKLRVPEGFRAVPSQVRVTVPVEPLVAKSRSVPLECHNTPEGMHLALFPPVVEVTYLLPKSFFNAEEVPVRAFVDFRDTEKGDKIPVSVSILPDYYRNVSVAPERVEFVRELK